MCFPAERIVFRADSGFCRRRMLSWCESHEVGYITGLAKNARLDALAEHVIKSPLEAFHKVANGRMGIDL